MYLKGLPCGTAGGEQWRRQKRMRAGSTASPNGASNGNGAQNMSMASGSSMDEPCYITSSSGGTVLSANTQFTFQEAAASCMYVWLGAVSKL